MNSLRTLLLASAMLVGSAASAKADGGDRLPFEGFYLGFQAGYDMSNVDYSLTDGINSLSLEGFSASGAEGGGFVGFGYVGGGMYLGLEGHVSYSSAEFTLTASGLGSSTTEAGLTYGGAVRLGCFPIENALFYGKIAVQNTEFEQTVTGLGSADETLTGVGVGIGMELALSADTFLRLEYQHTWYEELTLTNGLVTETYEGDAGTTSAGVLFRM